MRQKPGAKRSHGEKVVKDIRRATRKQYSAEDKIRILLDGLCHDHWRPEHMPRAGLIAARVANWVRQMRAGGAALAADGFTTSRT